MDDADQDEQADRLYEAFLDAIRKPIDPTVVPSFTLPPPEKYASLYPEGAFLFLDGGELDLGILRWRPTWRTILYLAVRPWKWRRLPATVHRWRHPVMNDFSLFTEAFTNPERAPQITRISDSGY